MDGFELFEGQRGRRTQSVKGPIARISRNGTLTLNDFAVGLFGKTVPENVQLLYNPNTRTVALKPAKADDAYTYRLRPDKSGVRSSVSAKSFAGHFGIDLSKRYMMEAEKADDLVVFQLPEDALVPQEVREPVVG